VPLLLFFSLVSFFTTEIWQVFTATDSATYWTATVAHPTDGAVPAVRVRPPRWCRPRALALGFAVGNMMACSPTPG